LDLETIEIRNYIGGVKRESNEVQNLEDVLGKVIGNIHMSTEEQVRRAKRAIHHAKISSLEISEIQEVIQRIPRFYFQDKKSKDIVSKLSGNPLSYVEKKVVAMNTWMENIPNFVAEVFQERYQRTGDKASHVYSSKGPVVSILAQNIDVNVAYILTQILLSKSPAIIRPSIAGAGAYTSLEYLNALEKAIDSLGQTKNEDLEGVLQMINLSHEGKNELLLDKLHVENASYVLFGSDLNLRNMEEYLASQYKVPKNRVISMGTGCSISVILEDATLGSTIKSLMDSCVFGRGADCTSTHIVYIPQSRYEEINKALNKSAGKFENGMKEELGVLGKRNIQNLETELRKTYSGGVEIIDAREDWTQVQEIPGPVLYVRTFSEKEDAVQKIRRDLERSHIQRNLVTSIYTSSPSSYKELTQKLPSFTFRMNRGTEQIDYMHEHQGSYILKNLVNMKVVEF